MKPPSEPIPFGPFQLFEPLGRGGAGQVWRARVPGQPLDIAVKQLRDDRWSPEAIARFLDEARATAALGHPNLVQVLDFGTVDEDGVTVPYLAMDLASGGTLLDRAGDLDWEGLSEAVLSVLDGLAFAHARGTTHLDVKGENILLGLPRDGRPGWRLVDFGIAFAAGRSTSGQVSGTPTHMAPEQWRSQWQDFGPWTDLYAFGAMVWHLVCGRPPYFGDLMELARQHMTGALPALAPTRPVPEGLAGWLARALQPDPGARFQHAADAADAWRGLGAIGGAGSPLSMTPAPLTDDSETYPFELLADVTGDAPTSRPAPAPVPAGVRPLPDHWSAVDRPGPPLTMGVLGLGMVASRVPPLVGRSAIRDRLWTRLGEVVEAGAPRALCLHGAAGCGKTRLATWLGRTAAQGHHGDWLIARFAEGEDGAIELAAACARFLRCEGLPTAEVPRRIERFLHRIGGEDPEDLELLIDLARAEAPPSGAALVRGLNLLSRAGPLVLVLDNAERAPTTLGLAGALTGPVLLLATWEGEPELPEPWASVAVEPLEGTGMRRLVEGMLPLTTPTVERLVRGSAGNPEEAVQRIVHHTRAGDFRPVGDRYELLPEAEAPAASLDGLWEARVREALEGFDEEALLALSVAAALGTRVRDEEWAAALESEPPAALVQALLDARIAVRPPRSAALRFAHPRVQTVLERDARARGRWTEAHRRCARALASLDADRGRIGAHLVEAGQHEAAVGPLLVAAETAFSSGRPHAAAASLAQLQRAFAALERPETDPQRIEALVITSRVDRQRHGPDASIPGAERALGLARAHGDPDLIAKAGRALAMAIRSQRRREETLTLLESLLDELGDRMGPTQRSRLLAALGVTLCDRVQRGESAFAERAHAALDEAVALGGLSAAQGGDALLYRARLYDEPDQAEPLLRRALAAYEEAGTIIGRAISHHDLAALNLRRRAPEVALDHYRESARLFSLTGSHAADTARLGIALALAQLDRHPEARPVFDGVVDRGRRLGRHVLALSGIVGQIDCAIHGADWREAALLLDQAEAMADGVEVDSSEIHGSWSRSAERARASGEEALADRLLALRDRAALPAAR